MAEKFTIFQRLEGLFGPEKKKEESKSRYSLGDDQNQKKSTSWRS